MSASDPKTDPAGNVTAWGPPAASGTPIMPSD